MTASGRRRAASVNLPPSSYVMVTRDALGNQTDAPLGHRSDAGFDQRNLPVGPGTGALRRDDRIVIVTGGGVSDRARNIVMVHTVE